MAIAFIIRDGSNVPRTVTAWLDRNGSNTQKTIAAAFDRDVGNVSRLFFNPSGSLSLAVSLNTDTVSGFSAGTGTATSDLAIATATGGTAPYTYAWTLAAPPDNPCVANAPTSGTTDFTMTGMGPGDSYLAYWIVTATDADSNTATANVTAIFSDLGGIM